MDNADSLMFNSASFFFMIVSSVLIRFSSLHYKKEFRGLQIKASCNPAEKLYNRYKKQTGGESDDDT